MIGFAKAAANKRNGTDQFVIRFEGDNLNYGNRTLTLTENGTVNEQTTLNPMRKGLYCAYPLAGTSNYTTNSITAYLGPSYGDLSFDCMLYIPSLASRVYIWSWVRWGFTECWWGVETDGTMGFGYNGGLAYGTKTPAGTITTGVWHHCMWRQHTSATKGEFYVNGVKVYNGAGQDFCCSIGDGYIGAYRLGGGGTFYMKDFRVCVPGMKAPRPI